MTSSEVGSGILGISLYGEDGSDGFLDYWYVTIKLPAGASPINLDDLLLTMSSSANSRDYSYDATTPDINVFNQSGRSVNVTLPVPDCDDSFWNFSSTSSNTSSMCTYTNQSNSSKGYICRNLTEKFGINYAATGSKYKSGYVSYGDIVTICWNGTGKLGEGKRLKVIMVPKVGSALLIETVTPNLMMDQRITIYP